MLVVRSEVLFVISNPMFESSGTLQKSEIVFTKASVDRLVDGAVGAARASRPADALAPQLALLISCVGRKLILKQRVEEEVEGVRDILGPQVVLTGFYSYGEIAPFSLGERSELHNQTMTVTTFAEG